LAGADRPTSCNGKPVDDEWSGLGEGIPEIPKLRSRTLKVFGAIEVAYHQFTPGEIETLPFKGPVVNLHLSAPHRMVQRQNGHTRSGLVATNDAAVTPAGVPGYWRTDAASEDMSMLLEEGFIRRVATETGVEPEGVEVVPLFSAPEPQIERLGLSLLSEMESGGLGGELYAESLANVLALHLLRQHSSLGRAPPGESSGARAESPNELSNRPPIT
jgi:AraC family transcriptional regulator